MKLFIMFFALESQSVILTLIKLSMNYLFKRESRKIGGESRVLSIFKHSVKVVQVKDYYQISSLLKKSSTFFMFSFY